MGWISKYVFNKTSHISDKERLENNIQRLHDLKKKVHELGYFTIASQSGGFRALQLLLEEQIVRGRPQVWKKLSEANIGENNQKIALDAPTKFREIMVEAESLIQLEINKELRKIREIENPTPVWKKKNL